MTGDYRLRPCLMCSRPAPAVVAICGNCLVDHGNAGKPLRMASMDEMVKQAISDLDAEDQPVFVAKVAINGGAFWLRRDPEKRD